MDEDSVAELARKAVQGADGVTSAGAGDEQRLELFQSSLSLCSQKVRTVLAHLGTPYACHELNIICRRDGEGELHPADNYRPDYVRLRLRGGSELDTGFARSWSGVTSVATEGFDPCVVPTLVDRTEDRVVVDSQRIVEHLARISDDVVNLMPEDPVAAERVREQLRVVDRTPHGSLLAGFHPDDDTRPEMLREIMLHYHVDKLVVLERLIRENADDPALVEAYRSKIDKENIGEQVCHDDEAQRGARERTARILLDLDVMLDARETLWLCSAEVSLADLAWGVSLTRMQYLGLEKLWDRLPRVALYHERLRGLDAVVDGAVKPTVNHLPPSPHIAA